MTCKRLITLSVVVISLVYSLIKPLRERVSIAFGGVIHEACAGFTRSSKSVLVFNPDDDCPEFSSQVALLQIFSSYHQDIPFPLIRSQEFITWLLGSVNEGGSVIRGTVQTKFHRYRFDKCRGLSVIPYSPPKAPPIREDVASRRSLYRSDFLYRPGYPGSQTVVTGGYLLIDSSESYISSAYTQGGNECQYPANHRSPNIEPIPRYRHGGKFDDSYGMLCICFCFFLTGLAGWGVVCLHDGKLWRGWLLIVFGAVFDGLAITTLIIGCLPGSWHRCLCDGEEHSEYRQTYPQVNISDSTGNLPHGTA